MRLADQSQARAAEQMRVDFVANASHELRTPLATLLGFLETLQDEDAVDAETRARFVAIMFGEATRMRDLLDDLMSLSRIEAERFAAPRDTVDLLPLIEEVRDGAEAARRGPRAPRRERAAGEALVSGDRGQLAQMLNNLVVNALKYGRAGTPVRIRLDDGGAGPASDSAVIDEGEGIAAEHIPRLTERFYRVDPGRSRAGRRHRARPRHRQAYRAAPPRPARHRVHGRRGDQGQRRPDPRRARLVMKVSRKRHRRLADRT